MIKKIFLLNILLLFTYVLAQEDKRVNIVGKDLYGSELNGESIRRVIGDVIITQGNVRITCDEAIQYINRSDYELFGNVVIVRDTITLRTNRGFYNSNDQIAYSHDNIKLDDTHLLLEANIGYYLINENKAQFRRNVVVYDKDNTLTADYMDYYEQTENMIAYRNVKAKDSSYVFYCDSLIYSRVNQNIRGYKDILIYDIKNNLKVTGAEFEREKEFNYFKINGDPILTQIDTTSNGETTDTLLIKSKLMELYNDSTNTYIAIDSVQIIRGDMLAKSNYMIYKGDEDKIFTYKQEDDVRPPVMWVEENQIVGDSINIYLDDKKMKRVDLNQQSFIISQNKDYVERFNQMAADSIKLHFEDNELIFTEFFGNVLSIYYMFDEKEPNGLIKSSGDRAKILFEEKKVAEVKFYSSVESDYFPENKLKGNEKDFIIPNFILYFDKPNKEELFEIYKKRISKYNE